MTKIIVQLSLTPEEWAYLGVMQSDADRTPGEAWPRDELISSILRAVIADDLAEERKCAQ
jgi:hypothetical protein